MPTYQRARRPEQKEERRAAILDAARALARDRPVRDITLTDIAAEVGMAKSAVLRYFETREEVYLHLLAEEWQSYVVAAEERLRKAPATPAGVAGAIAATYAERPLFCDLTGEMPAALERNVSAATAVHFKTASMTAVAQLGAVVAERLPKLGEHRAQTLVGNAALFVGGLWDSCNPPPEVVAQLPEEFRHHLVEFEPRLREAVEAMAIGLSRK
jgi:AcrR family transcriptional regulator